jgi:hypothetical protein
MVYSDSKALKDFPPALDQVIQVVFISSKIICAGLLSSLKMTAFRCFQMLQQVKIASVCTILSPLSSNCENQSSMSSSFVH